MGDRISIRPLFTRLRNLGFPASFQSALDLLERDERMPAVWQSLICKGYTLEEIAPLIRAILQLKDLANDPAALPRKLGALDSATKNARALADFYSHDPTSSEERERADQSYWALRSRYDTLKSASESLLPPLTHLDNAAVFSTILSRVLVQNFEQPLDDMVATVTTVLFNLPDPLDANTIGTRRRREEKRRVAATK